MKLPEFWQAIQSQVCLKCIEGDGKGACRLPAEQQCPIKSFLPQIVMTIVNTRSESFDSCINALRRHVCILCDYQMPDATCLKRTESSCVLDRYTSAVIEIVRTVRDNLAAENVVSDGVERVAG